LKEAAEKFGLEVAGFEQPIDVPRHELDLPRLGVYHTWLYPQDAGWVYFTLEKAGISFAKVNDERMRKGELRRDFDVLLIPNQWGDFRSVLRGIPAKHSPIAYNKTDEYKYLGGVDSSDDITGGMKFEGLMALEKFVDAGGVLIALDSAASLPIQIGLADEIYYSPSSKSQISGAFVKGKAVRKDHPILYGFPEETALFKAHGSVFEVGKKSLGHVVFQYGSKEPVSLEEGEDFYARLFGGEFGMPASAGPESMKAAEKEGTSPPEVAEPAKNKSPVWLSGLVKNEEDLDGRAAIVDVPFGKGRVVLFNFNPLYRALNQANFLFVYNAILNFNDLNLNKE